MEVTLQEFSSAKKNIQLLQEGVNAKHKHDITQSSQFKYDLNFVTGNNKLRRKRISNKWENNNIMKLQQSQPIPVVVNKYFVSLQENQRQ